MTNRIDFPAVRRLVLKVGSSLLADPKSGINLAMVRRLALDIKHLQSQGVQVCLVSSGAVALGRVQLGWLERHLSVHEKQAAAAIGQPMLMHAYQQVFSEHGLVVAQMLLTKDDLRHRRRYLNASNTSKTLFSEQVIPIVNENDTVVVEEIKFGDNDSLGALVSLVVEADLMVMMTDVDGLFDANPMHSADAKRIRTVESLTPKVMNMAGGAGSSFGTGGMLSKLHAARISTQSGVPAVIINGSDDSTLRALFANQDVGTSFLCGNDRHSWHQHWIADLLPVSGRLQVQRDAKNNASLNIEDVSSLTGSFDKGECVELHHADGLIGRGLVNYNAKDMEKLLGHTSQDIERVLGYVDFISMIHSDNLVMLNKG